MPEDENAFCVFTADSAAVVEEAYARAGVGFERIVDALEAPIEQTTRGRET